ncbi:MAG: transposase [Capsulimonadales bacterium]|nr:transposase [Capsulimonadales bacterium]
MQRAFRYRAYPNREQEEAMTSLLEAHRRLYNNALAERKCVYESEQRTVTYGEQSAKLKVERKVNPYLALCNFSSCQRTLRRLDRAFQAFFRRLKTGEKARYPRFRGYGQFDSVDFTIGDGAKLTKEGKAYFQNVGEVKVKLHRPVEGEIKTATFRRCADGWYVIFVCEVEQKVTEPSPNPPIGIDLGLKSFLVTSDGESVEPPKLYRKAQAKLRRCQRSVARKKRGGKNRRKAVKRLARVHAHVANQRKDFHHKVAKSLIDRYGLIAHEDLNVKGMVRSLNLAKSTHDAGWSQFLEILRQKAECAAVSIAPVNPSHTTQTCRHCGCLPTVPIDLSVRLYTCEHCGFSLDRDHNAAINILKRAGTLPLQANVGGCPKRSARSPRL